MKFCITAALVGLLRPTRTESAAGFRADCQDLLEERFFYATQVRISNVHCTGKHDLARLADLVTDHLVSPIKLRNSTTNENEIDACRALPLSNREPCPGYLSEQPDATSLDWNWRGIGSCGIFQPNPDCDSTNTDSRLRRAMDVQRLRGGHNAAPAVPEFQAKKWLSDEQKAQLKTLVLKREKLISSDRHLEEVLTEHHFASEFEMKNIMEQHKGNEKMVLSQILDLFSEYESQAEFIKARVGELEEQHTIRLESLLLEGHNLRGECFVEGERPQVDVVITLMATEGYAMAYVDEQC